MITCRELAGLMRMQHLEQQLASPAVRFNLIEGEVGRPARP